MTAPKTSLAEFIHENLELILGDWEEYARSLDGTRGMDKKDLRDHAKAILVLVADDMAEFQSGRDQKAKSRGDAPKPKQDSAAEQHGRDRQLDGLTVNEMASEFRALRASVTRLWVERIGTADRGDLDQLIRFNEGIDQALAESMVAFDALLKKDQELLVGILGHDLRNPLATLVGSAHNLAQTPLQERQSNIVAVMGRAAGRMQAIIGDLLDLTRTRFGRQLPIQLAQVDLSVVCERIAEELRVQHPDASIDLRIEGDMIGNWDGGRISQMLSNVVGNAIQHGVKTRPVTITAHGDPKCVVITVHNYGSPLSESDRRRLFEPMAQGKSSASQATDGLGLGLYIASQVAHAHGGNISVDSAAAAGTTFTMRLARNPTVKRKHREGRERAKDDQQRSVRPK